MGAFGLRIALEVAPELLDDGGTFREHEEGEDKDENEGSEEAADGADASGKVGAQIFRDAGRDVLNIVNDFTLEVFDTDRFAEIIEPGETVGNSLHGLWEILCKVDGLVDDGRNNDSKECGQTADNDEIGNGDWKFDAFAGDNFCKFANKWIDGEGNEKRGADNEKAGGGFE